MAPPPHLDVWAWAFIPSCSCYTGFTLDHMMPVASFHSQFTWSWYSGLLVTFSFWPPYQEYLFLLSRIRKITLVHDGWRFLEYQLLPTTIIGDTYLFAFVADTDIA